MARTHPFGWPVVPDVYSTAVSRPEAFLAGLVTTEFGRGAGTSAPGATTRQRKTGGFRRRSQVPDPGRNGDRQCGTSMAQQEFQFGHAQIRIDGHNGCAEPVCGQQVHEKVGSVLQRERHAHAGGETCLRQFAGPFITLFRTSA